MLKSYVYKLYQNKHSKVLIEEIELASKIYNHCIALHKRYYKLFKEHLKLNDLQKHITKIKKRDRYLEWNRLNSQSIQDITQRIERGYRLFFNLVKKKRKSSPPSFKQHWKYKSFTLKQCGYKLLDGNSIRVGKYKYRFHKSREIEGEVKTLTIKRDNLGNLYLVFALDVENKVNIKSKTGKIAGFDFGCKVFLTSNSGEEIESPYYLERSEKKIRKAQRVFSRKGEKYKGKRILFNKRSNSWKRARMNLVRCHEKIANQRKDFNFKLARRLLNENDILVFEDLNMRWMQSRHGKKVLEHSFSQFISILKFKSEENDKRIIEINQFYPSSQLCSECGYQNKDLKLNEREWKCLQCGVHRHRDVNAAKNIIIEGMREMNLIEVGAPTSEFRISETQYFEHYPHSNRN